MCNHIYKELGCGHWNHLVASWCDKYVKTEKPCPLNVVRREYWGNDICASCSDKIQPSSHPCAKMVQLIAAIAAAGLTDGLLPGPLGVANTLGGGTSTAQGLFIEMFLTAQLVLTVYFLAVEKHRATFLAPVGIGISVFIAHIAGTRWTGTSINPARSFGPAVITGFTNYHWIYWLGPFMGAGLAYVVYTTFKWLEYQTANPGQDNDDLEKAQPDRVRPGEKSIPARLDDHPKPFSTHARNDSVLDGQVSPTT